MPNKIRVTPIGQQFDFLRNRGNQNPNQNPSKGSKGTQGGKPTFNEVLMEEIRKRSGE